MSFVRIRSVFERHYFNIKSGEFSVLVLCFIYKLFMSNVKIIIHAMHTRSSCLSNESMYVAL